MKINICRVRTLYILYKNEYVLYIWKFVYGVRTLILIQIFEIGFVSNFWAVERSELHAKA